MCSAKGCVLPQIFKLPIVLSLFILYPGISYVHLILNDRNSYCRNKITSPPLRTPQIFTFVSSLPPNCSIFVLKKQKSASRNTFCKCLDYFCYLYEELRIP